ncbi:MAG: DEAD/DEAH box helicase [Promethearchaeota archaeon]
MQFTEMDINPQIIKALEENNIVSPTEIQEKSIPHGLSMRKSHVIGQAKTGSGKTLAFAIPIIEKINPQNRHIQAVILVPTRELCKQNAAVFRSITKYKKVKIVEVYGGTSIRNQIEAVKDGGQVVIATPGRLIDLVRRRVMNFRYVNYVALDEADRMLDMGFLPDMQFLLLDAMRNVSPRLFLFSATMLAEIKSLIYKFTKNDEVHEINVSKDSLTVESCEQYAYYINTNKFTNFVKILNLERPEFSIIFTKTKRNAEELSKRLRKVMHLTFNLKVGFINGNLSQAKREKTIEMFRSKKLNCLVATNVLARGLDFPKVSHVFNYDMPRDPEDYVHRIGRTARVEGADREVAAGKAVSIVAPDNQVLMRKVEKLLNKKIDKRTVPGGSPVIIIENKVSSKSKSHSYNRYGNKKSNPDRRRNRYKSQPRNHPPKTGSSKKKKKSYSNIYRPKVTSSAK